MLVTKHSSWLIQNFTKSLSFMKIDKKFKYIQHQFFYADFKIGVDIGRL